MPRLILLRHAKSDWPAGVADHDRPLGKRGRRDAPLIGAAMAARALVPELAIVSTATRTRQTWDLVKPALGPVPERFERAIYEAEPEAILAVIRAVDDGCGTLLIVGHNPGLELIAGFLSAKGLQRERMAEKFPTGALAVIDFGNGGWRDVRRGQGELALFLVPGGLG